MLGHSNSQDSCCSGSVLFYDWYMQISGAGVQTLTQIPQRIDGLWLGRPGSVLLSVAQHHVRKLRFDLAVPPPGSPSAFPVAGACVVSEAQIGCLVVDQLRGSAPGEERESLLSHSALWADLHAFIPQEENRSQAKPPSPRWCHWDWIYNHTSVRRTLTSNKTHSAQRLPEVTFNIKVSSFKTLVCVN